MRAQEEMIRVLLQQAGHDVNLMDQQNAAGKIPRQIRKERGDEC
jgi:hypothetical protein